MPGITCFLSRNTQRQLSASSAIALAAIVIFTLTLAGCASSQPTPPAIEAPGSSPLDQAPPPEETPAAASTEAAPAPTSPNTASTQDGHPLAARVNGEPIFLEEYEKQVAQTEQALVEQGLIVEGEESQAQLTQIRQNVLNGLIEQAIIEQAAAAAGITVTDEELESTMQESIALGQGQESFEQWLAENNMTMEEFRETQRSQLLASKMIEQVTASVPTAAEQVHARHIRVSDRARAESLLNELKTSANFAALAQQESEDVSTAANGGDLGWFPRDVPLMPPPVVEAAFALQPGEISEIIESELGFHIIKVEAREDGRPLTPEMLLYTRQRAFETWLADQWSAAVIERYIEM